MVEAQNLRRSYDDDAVQALRGVTFSIARGEFVSITGPSGSGKSTLLRLIGALDDEFEGGLAIDGVDLRLLKDPEAFRSKVIGFVFQSFHLLPTLTALENVQMPMFETTLTGPQRKARAAALLESMGLGPRLHHLPSKLSGGERQRVAIARSLANEPHFLLADEPTGNLDSKSAHMILEVLDEVHQKRNMTILLVTHDPTVAARAQRSLRMLDGQIVEEVLHHRKPAA
jgi:ABC-type lipoprotein export system ATPase subunit